tara:strand:- start:2547 stop:3578 length:1032 start_codon:yes stop_codon:yes gene_type:complete
MLTIAYMTNRKDPLIKWFFDSLRNELPTGQEDTVKLLVVDYWAQVVDGWTEEDVERRKAEFASLSPFKLSHVAPKPSVWQGPHRLTQSNFFAASSARNTAICLAESEYIVFIDDLAVLMPGWLSEIKVATQGGWAACGSYVKPEGMVVREGCLKLVKGVSDEQSFTSETLRDALDIHRPTGIDSRLKHSAVRSWEPVEAGGSWLYGCSCLLPVEALLEIEGFDEDIDPMGGEDYCAGILMERLGVKFKYHPRMMSAESEEGHSKDKRFLRQIKGAFSSADASIRMLRWVMDSKRLKGANYWGDGGLRALREKVLNGDKFPVMTIPEHDWRDGQLLREMKDEGI